MNQKTQFTSGANWLSFAAIIVIVAAMFTAFTIDRFLTHDERVRNIQLDQLRETHAHYLLNGTASSSVTVCGNGQ